jgi:hypothetical protein
VSSHAKGGFARACDVEDGFGVQPGDKLNQPRSHLEDLIERRFVENPRGRFAVGGEMAEDVEVGAG